VVYAGRTSAVEYFGLKNVNENLAVENARLRETLYEITRPVYVVNRLDSSKIAETPFHYDFIASKVINNSVANFSNYITINKGRKHGIEPGMGVISQKGIVGMVKSVSNNYATVTSLLNINFNVSSALKRTGTFCTVKWDGKDSQSSKVLYVPRHVKVVPGDTIITSGYNAVFPENLMIGTVTDVNIEANQAFYNVDLDLVNDFTSLRYVYVIKNHAKSEIDSLEGELIYE